MTNASPNSDWSSEAWLEACQEIQAIDSQSERISVRVDDGEVVFRCLGSGPPLILLHGGMAAKAMLIKVHATRG